VVPVFFPLQILIALILWNEQAAHAVHLHLACAAFDSSQRLGLKRPAATAGTEARHRPGAASVDDAINPDNTAAGSKSRNETQDPMGFLPSGRITRQNISIAADASQRSNLGPNS
jgi:hypothetical protein